MLMMSSVLGLVTGVVLERTRRPSEAADLGREPVVDESMPAGSPVRVNQMLPDPRSLEGITPFADVLPRRMFVGTTAENGLGSVSWFETSATIDQVLGFYEEAWRTEHPMFTTHRFSERRGYIAYQEHQYDAHGIAKAGEGTLHMVSVSDEGGRTMVFLSATEPEKFFRDRELPGGVRVPQGLRAQVVRTGEVGQERSTVFASSHTMTLEEFEAAEQQILKEDGWAVVDRAVAPTGRATVVARRADFLQTIVVDAISPHDTSVLISVEQQAP
jgi:hypothetical protein